MLCATDACIAFSVDAILIDDEVCTILNCANNHQLCTFRESLNVFHPWNGLFLSWALRGPSNQMRHLWTWAWRCGSIFIFLCKWPRLWWCDLSFYVAIYSLVMSYCKNNVYIQYIKQMSARTWPIMDMKLLYQYKQIIFNYLFIWIS